VLIVDDLVDPARRALVAICSKAHFATVSPSRWRPLVDTFITEVSQDTWIYFRGYRVRSSRRSAKAAPDRIEKKDTHGDRKGTARRRRGRTDEFARDSEALYDRVAESWRRQDLDDAYTAELLLESRSGCGSALWLGVDKPS